MNDELKQKDKKTKELTKKPVVCVDFDGVLNTYKGWKGKDELYEPRNATKEFLHALSEDYNVVILSTRPFPKIVDWLRKYDLLEYVTDVTNHKKGAIAYIDDRAICFKGSYEETLKELYRFRTHWEKDEVKL